MRNIEERINLNQVKVVKYKEYNNEYIYDEQTEEYFGCVDSMEDHYSDNDLDMPKYVYGCELTSFSLDVKSILESASDEFDEGILDRISHVEELRKAIDEFNEENKNKGSYFIDYETIVEL